MNLRDFTWSNTEKKAARRAFEAAYERECGAIRDKLRDMIATAAEPADIWRIHDYLGQQRKLTDEKYDYRYSMLMLVFIQLLREGWLTVADLQGLSAEKIEVITRLANFGEE